MEKTQFEHDNRNELFLNYQGLTLATKVFPALSKMVCLLGSFFSHHRETPQTPRYATVPTNGIMDNSPGAYRIPATEPEGGVIPVEASTTRKRKSIFPGVAPFKVMKAIS